MHEKSDRQILGASRFKPVAAGQETRTLPLCYALTHRCSKMTWVIQTLELLNWPHLIFLTSLSERETKTLASTSVVS